MQPNIQMHTAELLGIYNARAAEAGLKALKNWKGGKDALMKRIADLPKPTKPAKPAKREVDYRPAIAAAGVGKMDAIKVAAEKLLTAIAFEEDERNWGIPYKHVLDEIHRIFPEAETTVSCLRWYVVHLNRDGVRVPFRKRSVAS